jgi:hypothetical protein
MGELIEPIEAARPARRARTATGEEPGIGNLRPKRPRIRGADA